jgi:glycosyltransferase involved in cell wall biosynthesis
MPEIVARIPKAKFVVVGKGRNRPELEGLARELNVPDSVEFIGWKDYSEIIPFFQNADVGIIPHHASEHTDSTVPNKLFEYMYFKVPVMVSDRPPLKRIVEETEAGIVFKTNDTSDFARKMLEIHRNSRQYGKSGHKAVMHEYNWQVDGETLVRLYRHLEKRMANTS